LRAIAAPHTVGRMPRPKKPPTTTVRCYRDVAKKISVIATLRGLDVADYLLQRFGAAIDADYAAAGEQIRAEAKTKK
jgi:hypothetical protein